MTGSDFIILSQRDLRSMMVLGDYVDAVSDGFRQLAEGLSEAPVPLHVAAADGGFHIKAATLSRGHGYFAVKVNGNYPGNRGRHGLPTIQGAVLLADLSNGKPLALVDSSEITLQRTAAATAVAASYLARRDSRTATICGCGTQAAAQLAALQHILRLQNVFAWDIDPGAAEALAAHVADTLDLDIRPVRDLSEATRISDAIVTCTSARVPFLGVEHVRPGTFIAAVGADSPQKSEIQPGLMAQARVVVDVLEQSKVMGDLHHAIEAGAMSADDVHGELGEIVAGQRPGRQTEHEITLFDSSGTGVQDVAATARAYELARDRGLGLRCRLA